jgi:hypothetical protein
VIDILDVDTFYISSPKLVIFDYMQIGRSF